MRWAATRGRSARMPRWTRLPDHMRLHGAGPGMPLLIRVFQSRIDVRVAIAGWKAGRTQLSASARRPDLVAFAVAAREDDELRFRRRLSNPLAGARTRGDADAAKFGQNEGGYGRGWGRNELTVRSREADALESILSSCEGKAFDPMVCAVPSASGTASVSGTVAGGDALALRRPSQRQAHPQGREAIIALWSVVRLHSLLQPACELQRTIKRSRSQVDLREFFQHNGGSGTGQAV